MMRWIIQMKDIEKHSLIARGALPTGGKSTEELGHK